MKKKILSMFLTLAMCAGLCACGPEADPPVQQAKEPTVTEADKDGAEPTKAPSDGNKGEEDFHIAIVTGSYAQSEDDRRGAEAFQARYGEDNVLLAIYPDNFTEELETTIQIIVDLADDPDMKAVIVNQAVDGTTEAFRRIKEKRPDILCIAGEAYEDFSEIAEVADLVVNSDFVARGYLMIRSAHELGCENFVHISFPRHLSYETVARQVSVMKAACEEFGMNFVMETAPDPTTEVGVPGAQQFITEHVPEWVESYGEKTAFFCTNDAHTEPLIRMLLKHGGYFIEADLPSPLMGYPGALDLDLADEQGDFEKINERVEKAIVAGGGAGRFGTWTYSYGYTVSAGLAEHARNVILGQSSISNIEDLSRAYGVFSPKAEWNGSCYTDTANNERLENTILIYQDTYIFGDPGYYMGTTKVEVPERYFSME